MHFCEICNYLTSSHCNLKKHNATQKHINLVKQKHRYIFHKPSDNNDSEQIIASNQQVDINMEENAIIENKSININCKKRNYSNQDNQKLYFCLNCCKEYEYKNSYNRHLKTCKLQKYHQNLAQEINQLKKEHEYKLEIEKLKNEISKKDYEKELEIKNIENKHLQLQVHVHDSNPLVKNTNNTNNIVNNTVINNVKISKVQFLNLNFSNVIDINTFIDNYKNKFGLNNQQTLTLLENYQSDGINSCITTLVHYLKKSAIQQYKELKGKDISIEDIILPFLLSDKSLREHFEKTTNGKWDKTTMVENIKRIISITNNQVFTHHNTFLNFNASQRKRIINGVLKASGFSVLSQISIPDFYKTDTNNTPINNSNILLESSKEVLSIQDNSSENNTKKDDSYVQNEKENNDESQEEDEEEDEGEDEEEEDEEEDEGEEDEEEDENIENDCNESLSSSSSSYDEYEDEEDEDEDFT
jgi:hypothetical protein